MNMQAVALLLLLDMVGATPVPPIESGWIDNNGNFFIDDNARFITFNNTGEFDVVDDLSNQVVTETGNTVVANFEF